MKKIILLLLTIISLSACTTYDNSEIWDKLEDHEDRIQTLEHLCGRMNTNIEALQTMLLALQNNDYVTNVVQVYEGESIIGYTIYFSKSGAVTIYHGKDGKDGQDGTDGKPGKDGQDGTDGADGEDGKDGSTPKIGVRKDADGVYYWTLNGDWLLDDAGNKIPTTGRNGEDGNDGEKGEDGIPGQDGEDGKDGKDGITPQLKIEDSYWYISYDNGKTWYKQGKATGEDGKDGQNGLDGKDGQDGKDGLSGDSMFKNVEITTNYIIITMLDDTQVKIPTWKAFEELQTIVNQVNANLSALQTIVTALQNNDYVTGVNPLIENGKEIGYRINFSKSGAVTIYHGQDGKDGQNGTDGKPGADGQNGQDGKDGSTPVIGVKQDVDGIYYWTINGEWLEDNAGNKIPATGKDGQNGANSTPGQNGEDGQDGKDGITPQLKIEDAYWYISYDNGKTWEKLGKATGEDGKDGQPGADGKPGQDGAPGADGKDGDSFFQSVDVTDANFIKLVLADGTIIELPTRSAFETLQKQVMQMNSNIDALRIMVEALQNNDYVTGIVPVRDGINTIGYTLTFSKSGDITIYHGKDGANGTNGTNGADGHTPIIGVKQLEDGLYYWTVDGEWLVDEAGRKIPAQTVGSDGSAGASGVPGIDGKDGITPKLKIENGYWYVSYDDEKTWHELGKATGEDGKDGQPGADGQPGQDGAPGADGKDGDSFFQSVDVTDANFIKLVLADGTVIELPTRTAFEALQKQVNTLNSNISALQAIVEALQKNIYVTSVSPIYEGGTEIGYVINFSDKTTATIKHGQDGQNGQDGAPGQNGNDGTTPTIGVAKDTDGVYYWTVNGAWLLDEKGQKVKAVGTDGQDGAPGQNGSNGSDGTNGTDGIDGITPLLKIENGKWFVSYQNGTEGSWIELGQATGDQGPQGPQGNPGQNGTNGSNGDAFFSDINNDDPNFVIFTLADGTEIKLPTWTAFEALQARVHQINTNISSLQTIVTSLENRKYVTSVSTLVENGIVIGYLLNFSEGGPVTIYHGIDGASGKDGQNGQTPVIGVMKDLDEKYYWTLNGEWLEDADGNKIPVTGNDGRDGVDGKDGADGITPMLKIESSSWYISYDNGTTWQKVNQTGNDEKQFFKDVTYDDDNVYFTLWDGTVISIPTNDIWVGEDGGYECPFEFDGYLGPNGEFVPNPAGNVTKTTDFIDISEASSIYYYGRMGPVSNYYSIAFYDADKNFLADISICGTGQIETYNIALSGKYSKAVYVKASWAKGPNLSVDDTVNFIFIIDGHPKKNKKIVAVLGDSIGTHGNTGEYCNVVEVEIMPEDVGVELNAYLTYYDTHNAGEVGIPTGEAVDFVIGGKTFTEADNGKLITFTPSVEDIGKKVGKVYNYNPNSLKTWWLWLAEAYDMEPVPVCWSSSSICSHETSVPRLVNSYAWHDSQVRKCGVRIPGTNKRKAPDYIIIARGTNDWSHGQGASITDGYFNNPESWTYPENDIVGSYFGIKEAVAMTVKNMRQAYPKAKIFLCTIPYNTRGSKNTFPPTYGGKSWISYNNAIKECAEFFGCGLIDFAASGLTYENVDIYTSDGTHLNADGHKLAGMKAIRDFGYYETDINW